MIKTIIVELHQNVLGTKIYWENKEEKKAQTEFWKKYQEATTEEERDIQIAIKEIKDLMKDKKIKLFALFIVFNKKISLDLIFFNFYR